MRARGAHRVMSLPKPANRTVPSPSVVRIGACTVDLARREVTREGVVQTMEPRVFATLVYLLERRTQIVPRDEICDACWGGKSPNGSALPRAILKLRRTLGEEEVGASPIRAIYGIGYQLTANVVALAERPPADLGDGVDRLILLPVADRTTDRSCVCAELDLASTIAADLRCLDGASVVPLQDTLAALCKLPPRASRQAMLHAVEASLGSLPCVWSELRGRRGRYELTFALILTDKLLHAGTLLGGDRNRLAVDAAASLRHWICTHRAQSPKMGLGDPHHPSLFTGDGCMAARADSESAPSAHGRVPLTAAAGDRCDAFSDPFLCEVLARALRCNNEGRYEEALHLLEVLHEYGAKGVEVVLQTAKALVALGHPRAEEALMDLDAVVRDGGAPEVAILSQSLFGMFLEQRGRIGESVEATLEGLRLAERHGLEDLKVRMMVESASRMAMAVDVRADAMLSRATAHARHLGKHPV